MNLMSRLGTPILIWTGTDDRTITALRAGVTDSTGAAMGSAQPARRSQQASDQQGGRDELTAAAVDRWAY